MNEVATSGNETRLLPPRNVYGARQAGKSYIVKRVWHA